MHPVKILLFIILMVPVMASGAGCVHSESAASVPQQITGEITMVGNEPFSRLAVTAGGTLLLINCDRKIRGKLLALQGRTVRLIYDKMIRSSN